MTINFETLEAVKLPQKQSDLTLQGLVPKTDKFACIMLRSFPCTRNMVEEMLVLGEGLLVVKNVKVSLDSFWTAQVGEQRARTIQRERQAVILVHEKSQRLGVTEFQELRLQNMAHDILNVLLLYARPFAGSSNIYAGLAGEWRGDRFWLGLFTEIPSSTSCYLADEDNFRASAISLALNGYLYCKKLPYIGKNVPYARLLRGFESWKRALRVQGGDRLHLLVRALDAIFMSPVKRGRQAFIYRGASVIDGGMKVAESVMGDLYSIRSAVEHVHHWEEADCFLQIKPAEKVNRAKLRNAQAEILAANLYLQIFRDAQLRQHFRSEECIEKFWAEDKEAPGQFSTVSINLSRKERKLLFSSY